MLGGNIFISNQFLLNLQLQIAPPFRRSVQSKSFMSLMKMDPQDYMYEFTHAKILEWGWPETSSHLATTFGLMIVLGILLFGLQFLLWKFFLNFLVKVSKNSKNQFDDYLVRNKMMLNLSRLILIYACFPVVELVFSHFEDWISPLEKFFNILLVVGWLMVINSLLRSFRDFFKTQKAFEGKPLNSYLQVINILLVFIGGVVIFTTLTGKSPWAFLTAMGAASAILMLVFKDTILGFVASIQVATNDMVRIGDWIEMPKYGADGDVVEINLNTVKVQNWDKTITTIPTYYLITDSFKNWRGMQDSGGRRIKRAVNIKISSIHYVNSEEIEELKKIKLLAPFIEKRQAEIDRYNSENFPDRSMPVNGRNMTNVGLFRQYIKKYVENHPGVHQNMTLMVRQLSPTELGLPLELYMFSTDINWTTYEDLMSDVFDHLLAAVKFFNLEVFESPASDDIRKLGSFKSELML